MTWKDKHRDEYAETDLTWAEFHDERFIHVDELNDLRDEIESINDHLEATTNSYRQLARELHEMRVLLQSDEFDP